jgi:hypothetical protein
MPTNCQRRLFHVPLNLSNSSYGCSITNRVAFVPISSIMESIREHHVASVLPPFFYQELSVQKYRSIICMEVSYHDRYRTCTERVLKSKF